ncbi:hypothetical protein C3F09_03600 [candidate division GN15 bacterium]|uniref:NFACT RNA-binding domain-containing protein n=1 Tax=candidate division GN15 bacterium TaxID=2072418 RepID=A0A855XAM1_9BACT|nr:MAG: hypothetical protein C3F09_03600 [candidate division GN15 bacterium]
MQTALHILALVNELRHHIVGGRIVNTEFYKKERAAYFFIKSESTLWALGFVFHPHGSGFFLVPASKIRIDTKEKPWPIFDLAGSEVVAIDYPQLDRLFQIRIRHESVERVLAFEALGPNGNVWLLDSENHKLATLRKRDFGSGDRYDVTPVTERIDPRKMPLELVSGTLQSSNQLSYWIERHVAGFNKTMAREVVVRAGLSMNSDAALGADDLDHVASTIADLSARFENSESGYLYTIAGGLEAYPFKLSSVTDQPEKFKSLSFAVMELASRRQSAVEEVDEKKTVMQAIQSAIRKLERRIQHVEKDIDEASDYEQYRRLGDLLHSNFTKLKRGLASITVEDTFSHTHAKITIPLDSALSPKQNVESYYKRHRKGREGLDLLKRRLEISNGELTELKQIHGELDANFDSASEKYRAELTALMPRESVAEKQQPRLPYREHTLSTGLTIYIGRDGSDNDRTTFEFAKPYELWFHTQQCPGSHVVIKFPNKSFEPSKREIEETAAIAAYHSKAKNDSLVPVIYTERRYVRKPRGAKPGLVTVEREKSIMVAPRKPK